VKFSIGEVEWEKQRISVGKAWESVEKICLKSVYWEDKVQPHPKTGGQSSVEADCSDLVKKEVKFLLPIQLMAQNAVKCSKSAVWCSCQGLFKP
jgi:hypothetical protein